MRRKISCARSRLPMPPCRAIRRERPCGRLSLPKDRWSASSFPDADDDRGKDTKVYKGHKGPNNMQRAGQVRFLLCVLCLALCVLVSPACGYSLAGRGSFLPAYIQTIGIPTFTNRTSVFNLETMLTQKVRAEFIGRGKYQILPQSTGVDALLTGDVTNVNIAP